MLKALGNLVALDRETLVAAVGQLLHDAALVELQHANGLLPIVHGSHAPLVELSLEGSLLLLDELVGQLDLLVVCAIDTVPDVAEDVLAGAPHLMVDLLDRLL